jgi:hypothetical protein
MTVDIIRDAQIWASKFCTLASVIYRPSVWKLPHFILLVPRILRRLLDFWEFLHPCNIWLRSCYMRRDQTEYGCWYLSSLWYALACFKTDEDLNPCGSDTVLQCLLCLLALFELTDAGCMYENMRRLAFAMYGKTRLH